MLHTSPLSHTFSWSRLWGTLTLICATLLAAPLTTHAQQFEDGQLVEAVYDDFAGVCTDGSPQTVNTTAGVVEIEGNQCADLEIDITEDEIRLEDSNPSGGFNTGGSSVTITFSQGSAANAPNITGFQAPVYENTEDVNQNPTIESFTSTSVTISAFNWSQQTFGSDPDGNPERAIFTLLSSDPDIALEDSDGTGIPNGDTNPSTAKSTLFPSQPVDGGSTTTSYTIRNTGAAALNVSSVTSSNTGDFAISSGSTGGTAAPGGGTLAFDVTFTPDAEGTRNATITVNSDDPNDDPYTFLVEGDGLVPTMTVEDASNNTIANGSGSFDYESVDLGTTDERFFRIRNTGDSPLTLDGLPEVDISGTNEGDFSVSTAPSSPIASGSQTSFGVTFDPQAAGARTATVSIANNDSDRDPYTFTLTGTGNNTNTAPVFANGATTTLDVDEAAPAASLSSLLAVDDGDTGQTLEWTVATGRPSNGTLSGFPASTSSGGPGITPSSVTYTPSPNYVGSDDFEISVSDGTDTDLITVDVTVTNLPPEFNSPATASVPENTTGLVLDVDADNGGTGANDDGIAYTLGGPDSGPFSINASNGELTLDAGLDFENPIDGNGDNVYEVEVTADDGESTNNTATQPIAITVTDISAPTATTDAATNLTTTTADLNGTVNPNGAETTVEFTYYPTDTPANTTTVTADESPVSGSSDAAVSTSISGLTPGVEYGYTVDATSGEGAATGSEVTFTTTGIPDADVFAETTPRTEIPNGNTFSYSDVAVGSAEPRTFSVENNGSSDLIINVAGITTSGSGDFQITSFPGSATIAPGNAESFEVTYTPSSLGSGSFSVSVPSNDPNDNPYVVTLEGTGTNTVPTISSIADQTIEEDATLGPISFTVGDDQTDASNLDVSATSDDQTLVPDANITLGGSGTDRILELNPASNENGAATITVTVDDTSGEPNATASTSFTLTVNAVPNLSITDGSTAGLDFTASVSPGTPNNPIGILALSADQSGASFEELTVTNLAPGVAGISAARLFWSDDTTLEPGTDTELASVTVDDQSAPSSILFDGFSEPVSSTTGYALLAIDVEPGATDGGVQFELSQPADLVVTGSEIATVNGASNTSFAALPLSNDATALPVEFAGINVQRSSAQGITIEWETLSELNNAGFDVQRVEEGAEAATQSNVSWRTLATVEGAGTTDEAQSYAFTDTAPPYAADSLTYRLRQLDADGTASFSEPVTVALQTAQPELLPTYPNPTRGPATIRFAVPEQQAVRLTLYDIMGRRVRVLLDTEVEGRTETSLRLDGLASGTYFLRMQTDGYTDTQRITVVR